MFIILVINLLLKRIIYQTLSEVWKRLTLEITRCERAAFNLHLNRRWWKAFNWAVGLIELLCCSALAPPCRTNDSFNPQCDSWHWMPCAHTMGWFNSHPHSTILAHYLFKLSIHQQRRGGN